MKNWVFHLFYLLDLKFTYLVNIENVALTATRSSSPAADEDLEEEGSELVENEVENLVENINVEDLDLSDDDQETEDEVQEEIVVQQPAPTAKEEKANGLL